MDRKFRHIACLLVLLLATQSVLAGSLHMCMNNGENGHDHHNMMLTGSTDNHSDHVPPASACDCGYYCAGTCVHACQGLSLITTLELVCTPDVEKPSNLLNSLFLTGYGTVPLRPPAIS